MSDLNITGSGVLVTSTTVTAKGVAAVDITPGQVVYADPAANNLLNLAQATDQVQTANVVGIALGSAGPNQVLTYAISGPVTLPTSGGGTTMVSGDAYVVSPATAGGIAPSDDLESGNYVTLLGFADADAGTLTLAIIPAATR